MLSRFAVLFRRANPKRITISDHVVNGAQPREGPFYGHSFLSTSGGRSWHREEKAPAIGVDENAAAPLRASDDGPPCVGQVCPGSRRLLINARNDGNCSGVVPAGTPSPSPAACGLHHRVQVMSDSAGQTWGERQVVQSLPEFSPTCGGLSRWGPMLLYSGVATTKPHDRANVTLWISTDDGAEYPWSKLVHEGPGGYSSVAAIPQKGGGNNSVEALCLFELGGISLARIAVEL